MKYSTTLKIKDINRVAIMIICDIIAVVLSLGIAHMLRANDITDIGLKMVLDSKRELVVLLLAVCIVLSLSHCYSVSWRYAGFKEYITLFVATPIGFAGGYIFSKFFVYYTDMH